MIECAARIERASASTEESVARAERVHLNLQGTRLGLEVARLKLEDAIARQEKTMRDYARQTDQIVAELKNAREERQAILEALSRTMDRLPPSPPDLRSA